MIVSRTRRWGASLGVILPKQVVNDLQLKEDQEIILDIQPKTTVLKEMFGMAKGKIKKPITQIIKEARAELKVD